MDFDINKYLDTLIEPMPDGYKWCSGFNRKPHLARLEEFSKGDCRYGLRNICKPCRKLEHIAAKQNNPNLSKEQYAQAKTKNPNICKEQHAKRKQQSPGLVLFNAAKYSAKDRNLEFSLSRDEWVKYADETMHCEVSGIEFSDEKKYECRVAPFSKSADRLDNNVGYRDHNTKTVCWIVNHAKHKYSLDDFFHMCKSVTVHNKLLDRPDLSDVHDTFEAFYSLRGQ